MGAGGLGFTTNTIGSTLICYGVSGIFLTAPLYAALESRLGMVFLFQCMAVACAVGYVLTPQPFLFLTSEIHGHFVDPVMSLTLRGVFFAIFLLFSIFFYFSLLHFFICHACYVSVDIDVRLPPTRIHKTQTCTGTSSYR